MVNSFTATLLHLPLVHALDVEQVQSPWAEVGCTSKHP